MKRAHSFSLKLLPSLIATVVAAGAHAQSDVIEEVFVSGVRRRLSIPFHRKI